MKNFLLFVLVCCMPVVTFSQDVLRLSIKDVIKLSRTQSPKAKRAIVERKNANWTYKIHKSNLSPKLTMDATLPSFSSSVRPITQSDGSTLLHEVSENVAGIGLQINQPLPFLGAEVFVKSGLNRYDNLMNNTYGYGGSPIEAGINLPLFKYNRLKWDKKIAPIEFEESKLRFFEDMEYSTIKAIRLFFDLALNQKEYSIAFANTELNRKLYEINKEKFNLGKISKSELLQVRLMLINSENRLQSTQQLIDNAELELKSHLGIITNSKVTLYDAPTLPTVFIDSKSAVHKATKNNSRSLGFVRRILETEREIAISRGSTGMTGNLYAAFGYATQFKSFNNIPSKQPKHQRIELGLKIPLIDWGRSKAVRTKAKIKKELIETEIVQEKIDMEREVVVLVNSFNLLQKQRELIMMFDSLSQERYNISHDRYLVGDISVVELNIAQQEKDAAMQQTLNMQRDIWELYYRIRCITLFDYLRNEKLGENI